MTCHMLESMHCQQDKSTIIKLSLIFKMTHMRTTILQDAHKQHMSHLQSKTFLFTFCCVSHDLWSRAICLNCQDNEHCCCQWFCQWWQCCHCFLQHIQLLLLWLDSPWTWQWWRQVGYGGHSGSWCRHGGQNEHHLMPSGHPGHHHQAGTETNKSKTLKQKHNFSGMKTFVAQQWP